MVCKTYQGTKISIPQGNDKTWTIRATNPDGTSKNMTGYTLIFTVSGGEPYLIQKTATLDTPTAEIKGHLTLTATELDQPAGIYEYDKTLFKDGLKQSSEIGEFEITEVINTEATP